MKKTLLSIVLLASTAVSASDYFEKPVTNYFPERSVIAEQLNDDIRSLGGFNRIESLSNNKDAKANYIIGQMTRLGIGYKQNAEDAYEYFKIASDNGSGEASYYLGMLVLGEDPLISLPYSSNKKEAEEKGISLIKLSAEKGYMQGQYLLANFYVKGEYVPKNYNLAMFWYSRAATQGHEYAVRERMQLEKNHKKFARDFDRIRMKMHHGSVEAMVEMAKVYIEGYILPKDYKKAYELLLSASRLGSKEATSILLQLEESYSEEIK